MGRLPSQGNGATVLDVGCGTGYIGAILASRGYTVSGIERQDGYGNAFPATVDLIEADLEQGLPPLPRQFDYVICADILEHLREPARLLRRVRDVMHPGSALIASLPNSGNIYFRLNVLLGRFPRHDRGLFDRTHLHFYVLEGWKELLAEGGFRLQSLEVTGIPVGLAMPAHARTAPVRAVERMAYELARIWKTLFAYQFVVTARLPSDATRSR